MSVDFVAIDFETANQNRGSLCSVGLVKVSGGIKVDEYYTLINPEDYYTCLGPKITDKIRLNSKMLHKPFKESND